MSAEEGSRRGVLLKWLAVSAVCAVAIVATGIDYLRAVSDGGYLVGPGDLADYDCEDLADAAVGTDPEGTDPEGTDAEDGARLLEVRGLEVTTDARETAPDPRGSARAEVLVCEGDGVWSDGSAERVRIRAVLDADRDLWVSYELVRTTGA